MRLRCPDYAFARLTARVGIAAALLLVASFHAHAQILQGAIVGNVTDSSGAAVDGAKVVATDQGTNLSRETVTNSAGGFSILTLTPGTYNLAVTTPGFQTSLRTGIAVLANAVARVDFALTVGQVNETVSVQASAATLQTDRADVHTELTGKVLEDAPVPLGLNYQNLFVLLPGVTPPDNSNSYAANPSRSLEFSVNGLPNTQNTTRIDGAQARQTKNTNLSSVYLPQLDAIEAVNISTNSFDSQTGLAAGSSVEVHIKEGSNAIHWSAYEFHTDDHLKAYAWLDDRTQPKNKFLDNQFGGTVGGPILKNKLFYFLSYEGTRYSEEVTNVIEVPTAAMKQGNFSASPTPIYNPFTGNANGTGRAPFSGNIIPPSMIDPGVQNLLTQFGQYWGNPNRPGSGALGLANNYSGVGPNYQERNQTDDKFSWNPTSKLSTFVRFGLLNTQANTAQLFGPLGGVQVSRANTGDGLVIGNIFSGTISGTYVATPHLVIDAYMGYQRMENFNEQELIDQNLGSTVLQIPGLQSSLRRDGGWPFIQINGFLVTRLGTGAGSTIGAANGFQPEYWRDPSRDYASNVSWVRGKHTLGAGIDFAIQDGYDEEPTNASGNFIFSQGTTQLNGGPAGNDYNAFASFLLGLPSTAAKGEDFSGPYQEHTHAHSLSLYVRDTWQVTPKLTVNLGTRWEYFPNGTYTSPNVAQRGVLVYNSQTNTAYICGFGVNPTDCGLHFRGNKPWEPRLGVAYRVTNSFVMRAGYGISVNPLFTLGNGYGDSSSVSLTAPNSFSYATTFRIGLPPVTPISSGNGVIVPSSIQSVSGLDNNYDRGYVQSWNFTLEKRIAGWVVSSGYVGTRSVNTEVSRNLNWSPIGGGVAGEQLNKLFGRTGSTTVQGSIGTQPKYDALQTRAQYALSKGLQIAASYTFSKAMANSNGIAVPSAVPLDYGPATYDIKHSLAIMGIAQSPFGKGKPWLNSGWAAGILGGWQLNNVLTAYSGFPFSATAAGTTLNAPGSSQRADCIAPPVQTGNIYQWYETSTFAAPTTPEFGTCGYDSLRGPRMINLDSGLDRNFKLTERLSLKFRVEAFNVSNSPHHAVPNPTAQNVTTSSFMQALDIRNTGRDGIDERTFRLGLRMTW